MLGHMLQVFLITNLGRFFEYQLDRKFALKVDNHVCPVTVYSYFLFSAIAACAAANLAIGTRNGEQET